MAEPTSSAEPLTGSGPTAQPATDADADRDLVRAMRAADGSGPARYWLTRFVFLRALGLIYSVAFLILWNQVLPLLGSRGLMPARNYLDALGEGAFWQLPSLFFWNVSDTTLRACAGLGLALSLALLCGVEHALLLALLW